MVALVAPGEGQGGQGEGAEGRAAQLAGSKRGAEAEDTAGKAGEGSGE
jgi:hypothetical protein